MDIHDLLNFTRIPIQKEEKKKMVIFMRDSPPPVPMILRKEKNINKLGIVVPPSAVRSGKPYSPVPTSL
jgi:hypothetical protein